MRHSSLLALTTSISLLVSGCAGFNPFGGGETTSEASPEPEESVVVEPAEESASPSPDASPAPETAASPTPPPVALARDLDLIPSTNPDQRVQAVQSNRSDPFSLVPTTPTVQLPPPPSPTEAAPPPGGGGGQAGGQSGGGSAPRRSTGELAPIPNLVPSNPGSPSAPVAVQPVLPPPPPQPTLAQAIEVLGVVQIGDTAYAIVNAPYEPSSRYVRAGQRLSNGEVLVSRIESGSAEPVVVFEQFGVEVITAVGGGGAPEESLTDAEAAALPALSQGT